MVRKCVLGCLGILVLVSAVFGIVKRRTYTDMTKEEGFMEQFCVAELSWELASTAADHIRQLSEGDICAVRVRATGEKEYLFKQNRQGAYVTEVYSGDGISPDEQIWVISEGWRLYWDDMTCNMKFVNDMQKDREYLLLLEGEVTSLDPKEARRTYRIPESIMAPVFCYDEIANTIIPVEGETTYVPYREVEENEFFVCSKEAEEILLELKKDILEKYPR